MYPLLNVISDLESIRPAKLTIKEDLLTLSVTHQRHRVDFPLSFFEDGITDPKLLSLITPDDRVRAEKIRDYFSKKIMMQVLRGQPVSPFRKALSGFIHSSGDLDVTIIPLVFRLPEFYDYDMELDDIFTKFTEPPKSELNITPVTMELFPIKHLRRKTKSLGIDEYWLIDENGYGYNFSFPYTPVVNPLLHLWEREYNKPFMNISGYRVLRSLVDKHYFYLPKWQLK
jgi:hypothetical protein